jgi:hypothetical protein
VDCSTLSLLVLVERVSSCFELDGQSVYGRAECVVAGWVLIVVHPVQWYIYDSGKEK